MAAINQYLTVWDAAEDRDAPTYVRMRVHLMFDIMLHIQQNNITVPEVMKLLETSQGRVSQLLAGKIQLFSLDALSQFADKLGIKHKLITGKKYLGNDTD